MTTTKNTNRIANLTPGAEVTLRFATYGGSHDEVVTFVSLSEDGQRATFHTDDREDLNGYDWEAYKFNGRWAYGSSAGRLSIVAN